MDKKMFKLTSPQRNIWNMESFYSGTNISNICGSGIIKEVVDIDILKKAINILVKENDSFRIRLCLKNGIPFQYFADYEDFDIEVAEVNFFSEFEAVEHEFAMKSFNLLDSSLANFKLVKFSNGNVAAILKFHHIISDSWSAGISIQEIVKIYHCLINGDSYVSPTFPYADFIDAEEKYLLSDKCEKDRKFWSDYLDGFSHVVSMPSVNSKLRLTSDSSREACRSTFVLEADLIERINDFCKEYKLTIYSFFMAVYSLFLAASSNLDDVIIGTPILNRTNFKQKHSTGMFISTVPFRTNVVPSMSFVDFGASVSSNLLSVFRHQKFSYADIVEDVHKSNSDLSSLFNVSVSYQITHASEDSDVYETDWAFNGTGIDELTVHIYDLNNTGILKIHYDYLTCKYSKEEVDLWHLRVLHLVNQILDNPFVLLKDLQYVTDEERCQILESFNGRSLDCPLDSNIIALFEKNVKIFPNQNALIFNDKTYTYSELNSIVNKFARYLSYHGVSTGDIVAVYLDKSDWFIISILAILKLGAAYLPMNTDFPTDRVSFILSDCNATVIVTNQNVSFDDVLCVNPLSWNFSDIDSSNLATSILPDSSCYVIYTSGSTGKPKGVCLSHSNLINFLYNLNDCFSKPFSCEDNCLCVANISFDASVQEIFAPLCFGATLVLYPYNTLTNIPLLCDILEDCHITFSFLPPNILDDVFNFVKMNKRSFYINKLSVGVETIKNSTLNNFYELNPDIEIVNGYGPSEATICSTFFVYHYDTESSTVPIGYPLKNNDIFILNFLKQLQPVGLPGEICVCGASVSKGYLNNDAMTSKSFVYLPYLTDKLVYLTGDLGFWNDNGVISFVGRNDSQIKFRGHRIELNEITNCVKMMDGVLNAVSVFTTVNDVNCICCYVASKSSDVTPDSVKDYLFDVLPYYMVPSHVMILDSLPLTDNGKIDRRNLPRFNVGSNLFVKPSSFTEVKLHNLLCKILNLEFASINDNFFDLGMDSLLAIRFSLEIYYEFGKNLNVTDLFQYNSISLLARFIDDIDASSSAVYDIPKAPKKSYYSLSSAQRRIYYASKMAGSSLIYNVSGGILFDGFLDAKKVQMAVDLLVQRHPSFRTFFSNQDGEVKQFILESCKVEVKCVDDGIMMDSDIQRLIDRFPKVFDLDFAPLLRVELHYVNNSSLLLVDSHHIILDGSSFNVMISDFCKAYDDCSFEELPLLYSDYSEWENSFLSSDAVSSIRDFWIKRFNNYEIPVMNLPYDYTVSDKKSFVGNKLHFSLGENVFSIVDEIAKSHGMSNYMVFLAALYLLLYVYTGQENIVIGSAMDARNSAKLEDLIGMFVNNLFLNVTIDGSKSFEDFLYEVKALVLDSLSNQPYPSDVLLKDLKIPANSSLFDVMFVYQNANNNEFYLDGKRLEFLFANTGCAKFPLTVEVVPSSYEVNFEFRTDLFKEDTISALFEHYLFILQNLNDFLKSNIDDINIITDSENLLLSSFNDTDGVINDDTFVSIFEDVVSKNPYRVAVICDDNVLTYSELNRKSNSLAHYLINAGVKCNDVVCIMTNRSLETIVCMLGILKAGAAFLNVDPTYPADRTQYYLEDCKAQFVLTQRALLDKVNFITNCLVIDLDCNFYTKNFDNPNVPVKPYDLSYVIYTSGSTGKPKGVLLHQVGFANMVKAMGLVLDYLKDGNVHCIASVTSTPFDIFVYEIFVFLAYGMKILLANNDEHRNPVLLDALISKHGADVMTVTPSLMKINYDNRLHPSALSNIKYMVFGGEPLPEKFVKDLRELSPGVSIYNIYGPSEITVLSNVQNLDNEDDISVGPPIMNTQIHILDKNLHRVPIGVVGEIYISGIQVGLGYLGKPELTSERFLDNPFGSGKMYKTGDIGRWTFDGKVQCLGRVDNQVKLRGLRIELGEIENKMECIPGVISSVVNKVVVSDREFLCGYYVCDNSAKVSENDVKAFLRKSLPAYMVPTYIVKLDKMPYSINRKIDRLALPMPDLNSNVPVVVNEKLSRKEKSLLKIWKDILHIDNISVNDNFFDIGGDSILAINMQLEALRKGLDFSYADIFNYPTISLLASKIKPKSFDILKSYDYSRLNKLLLRNDVDSIATIKDSPIGNVLLIGVTGFLGSHLIYSYLKNESGDIYCLIRQKDNVIPHERLKNTLSFYFGPEFFEEFQDRIHVVSGDITKVNLGLSEEDFSTVSDNISTVINSGAIVKHYGQRDLFENINVYGTRNVVDFCVSCKKRLLHVSTISISGNGETSEMVSPEKLDKKVVFSEKDLYIGQKLNNVYTVTKFEAERIVLEAIDNGLDAQILRVGNIVSRYSDGVFQHNFKENAFAKRIKSFIEIGALPEYFLKDNFEMTPVDLCADAILQIGNHSSKANVFHIYNTRLLPIRLFIDTLNDLDIKILPVSDEQMADIIMELLNDPERKDMLSGIIYDLDAKKRLNFASRINLDCDFTEKYLNFIGFSWKNIDRNYIIRYINYFKNIKFL